MADSVERRRVGVRPDPDLVEYLLVVVPDLGSLTSLTQALADLVDARDHPHPRPRLRHAQRQ